MATSSPICRLELPGMIFLPLPNLPNLPNLCSDVGKLKAFQHKGVPNLPNVPNLRSRVHGRTHPRVYVHAHDDHEKRLGRLGRLGRSRQDKERMFPTSKTRLGRLGTWR
jgi:hypothetical protein